MNTPLQSSDNSSKSPLRGSQNGTSIHSEAGALKQEAKDLLDHAVRDGKEVLGEAKEKAVDQFEMARERGRKELERTEEYVRSHPTQSLAYAFLGGLIVSLLLRRG